MLTGRKYSRRQPQDVLVSLVCEGVAGYERVCFIKEKLYL